MLRGVRRGGREGRLRRAQLLAVARMGGLRVRALPRGRAAHRQPPRAADRRAARARADRPRRARRARGALRVVRRRGAPDRPGRRRRVIERALLVLGATPSGRQAGLPSRRGVRGPWRSAGTCQEPTHEVRDRSPARGRRPSSSVGREARRPGRAPGVGDARSRPLARRAHGDGDVRVAAAFGRSTGSGATNRTT